MYVYYCFDINFIFSCPGHSLITALADGFTPVKYVYIIIIVTRSRYRFDSCWENSDFFPSRLCH